MIDPGTGVSEGIVTVLFTDVEGSTDLGARSGDEAARRMLRAHEDVVQAKVTAHGGRSIKSLGDGFMVSFPSTRKAIGCALAIQRGLREMSHEGEALRVRIGINVGEVIDDGGDIFGSTVSAAARICARAAGGEILVSEMVKGLAGTMPDVSFEDRGLVPLKGFAEPWRLYAVGSSGATGPGDRRRTPFVGRSRERSELRSFLDRLEAGAGGVVVVGGEPGVGKTRLVEEFLGEAERRGVRTLVGRCHEMESPTPYMPFVELLEAASREVDAETFRTALGDAAGEIAKVMPQLRKLFDDIPPPLEMPPDQERRYLFNCIAEFVVRAGIERPLIVLLDDVHWADESSLQLMIHVASKLEQTPVVVVATYRDTELGTHRPLARVLEDLMRRRLVHRIGLKRMDEESVADMLERLAGSPPPEALVEAIYRETDGNPFFVEEVFRHLAEEGRIFDATGRWRSDLAIQDLDVPESVRLVLGHRIDRLGETTRKVLVTAAVVGYLFDFELLEMVSEAPEEDLLDAVDESRRSGLIVSTGRDATGFRFVHELVRQTLLSETSAPRRQRLHLRVAEALEKIHSADVEEHAAEIAHHYMQAGASAVERTVHHLRLAAERALGSAAHDEAFRFLSTALELADDPDKRLRAPLLYDLGLALRSMGRHDEAMTSWREALTLYEELGDLEQVGRVAADTSFQLGWAARWDEAMEMGARGLASLGDSITREKARLLSQIAFGLAGMGEYEQSIELSRQALDVADRLGDDELRGLALCARGFADWGTARMVGSIEDYSHGCDLLEAQGERWQWCTAGGFLALSLGAVGRIAESHELLDQIEPYAERMGNAGASLMALRTRLMLTQPLGQPLEVVKELARKDLELCRESELPWISESYSILGQAQILGGEVEEGLELSEKGVDLDPPGVVHGMCHGFLFLGRARAGMRDEAIAMLPELEPLLPDEGGNASLGRWSLLLCVVEGLFHLGEEDPSLYSRTREMLERGLMMRPDGTSVEILAGMAASMAGLFDEAEEHYRRIEDRIATLRLPGYEAALAYARAGTLSRRGGREDEVRTLSARAAELWEAKGIVVPMPVFTPPLEASPPARRG